MCNIRHTIAYAFNKDNPDGFLSEDNRVRQFIQFTGFLVITAILICIILLSIALIGYFPGLLTELVLDQDYCPSIKNTTLNHQLCNIENEYSRCIFIALMKCGSGGVGLVMIIVAIILVVGDIGTKIYNSPPLFYSEDNRNGLILKVENDEYDKERFTRSLGFGYMTTELVWGNIILTVAIVCSILFLLISTLQYGIVIGYHLAGEPKEDSKCARFLYLNVTLQECRGIDACRHECTINGFLVLLLALLVIIICITLIIILSPGCRAFKSANEITMEKGELQPLIK